VKKILLITGITLLLLVVVGAAGAWFVWNQMQQPLYRPGMVRAGKNVRGSL